MKRNQLGAGLLLAWLLTLSGCGPRTRPVKPVPARPVAALRFDEVTQQAGVSFLHTNGALGKKWLPETMGSGLVWIDYDGDGWQDLFLVNSQHWKFPPTRTAATSSARATSRLFRNRGAGSFEDVSARTGLALQAYAFGACAGDYDNDGDSDLYVTALGRNYLFRNEGGGTVC